MININKMDNIACISNKIIANQRKLANLMTFVVNFKSWLTRTYDFCLYLILSFSEIKPFTSFPMCP